MKEIVTFESPDTIVLTLNGTLTPEKVDEFLEKWASFKPLGVKVKLLVDLTGVVEITPQARETLRKRGSITRVSRLSILGLQ